MKARREDGCGRGGDGARRRARSVERDLRESEGEGDFWWLGLRGERERARGVFNCVGDPPDARHGVDRRLGRARRRHGDGGRRKERWAGPVVFCAQLGQVYR
jgi:hypothetical protein